MRVYDFSSQPTLIIFEGADYTGKTTVSKVFAEHMAQNFVTRVSLSPFEPIEYKPLPVYWFRNPGGSPDAESMRDVCKRGDLGLFDQAQMYLSAFEETIRHIKQLQRKHGNMLLIADRWVESLVLYQLLEIQEAFLTDESLKTRSYQDLLDRSQAIALQGFGTKVPNRCCVLSASEENYRRRCLSVYRERSQDESDRFDLFPMQKKIKYNNWYRDLSEQTALFRDRSYTFFHDNPVEEPSLQEQIERYINLAGLL